MTTAEFNALIAADAEAQEHLSRYAEATLWLEAHLSPEESEAFIETGAPPARMASQDAVLLYEYEAQHSDALNWLLDFLEAARPGLDVHRACTLLADTLPQ